MKKLLLKSQHQSQRLSKKVLPRVGTKRKKRRTKIEKKSEENQKLSILVLLLLSLPLM